MFLDWIRHWGELGFAVFNLLLVWVLWSLGRRFVGREDLSPLSLRVDAQERQLLSIRHHVDALPNRQELEVLRRSQNAIEIKLARIEATVRKLDETTRRLSDYLLNHGG